MISVQEADQLLEAALRGAAPVEGFDSPPVNRHETRSVDHVETLPLGQASGRVLAQEIVADRDFPPFDRVAMDGIAVHTDAMKRRLLRGEYALCIDGTQAAGEPQGVLSNPESCLEIMTGAPLPHGCDAVLPVEWLRVDDGWARIAAAHLQDALRAAPGRNIHARASDGRAGDVLLSSGQRVRAPELAALASVGCTHVRVAAAPRIHVITTGDEAVPVASPVEDHQIRQSNGPALAAALGARGYRNIHLEHALDKAEPLQRAVHSGLGSADVIILTGGVSAGRFDLVPGVLAACGVRQVFHRVRQRPGKPLWFGKAASGAFVFGLPGNPVSALVSVYRYVLPFLSALETARPAGSDRAAETFRTARPLVAARDIPAARPGWTQFVPVRLGTDGVAVRVPMNGSGDLVAMTAADGFVELRGGPVGQQRASGHEGAPGQDSAPGQARVPYYDFS